MTNYGNYDDVNGLYEEALDLATIDDEECVRCYDEIIGINSGEGMAWRGKGLALGRLERPQEAIDCFDKALEIDPYDDIAQRSKDIELEEIKAIDAMTHSPDMSSLVTKGLELELDEKYEEAIQCYDEALKINPNDESVWENKADALASLDKYEEALQCYDEALEINPENEHALTMKGTGLFQLKKYDEALQCYDEALQINPENEHALTMKDQLTILVEGVSSNISDDVSKEMIYRNLENVSDPSSAFMKGYELFQLKKYEEAIPYLKKAIPSPELDGMLGVCFRKIEKYEESITYFDKVLSVEPENEIFLEFKGFSLSDLEIWDEYVTIQTKLLEINPDDAMNWFNKAEALDKLCKYSESISCYEKGFKINPEDPDISDWSSDDGTAMQSLDAVKAKLSEDSSSKTAEKVEVIEKSEPLDVLKMRLAKGEITLEEFNKIKEHLEYDIEGIEKEVKDELSSYEKHVKSLPKEPDEKLEEVKKLKTRNPYKAKGVIIGLIFVILFIPFFIGVSDSLDDIMFLDSDKMSPLIEEYDLMYMSNAPISDVNYNDLIFYKSSDKLMVNKVVGIIADDRVDYIFTVKNTASPTIKKVTEEQYLGKMEFVVGNIGEYGYTTIHMLRILFFPIMIIPISVIGFIVPIIVMRHRAKINV